MNISVRHTASPKRRDTQSSDSSQKGFTGRAPRCRAVRKPFSKRSGPLTASRSAMPRVARLIPQAQWLTARSPGPHTPTRFECVVSFECMGSRIFLLCPLHLFLPASLHFKFASAMALRGRHVILPEPRAPRAGLGMLAAGIIAMGGRRDSWYTDFTGASALKPWRCCPRNGFERRCVQNLRNPLRRFQNPFTI